MKTFVAVLLSLLLSVGAQAATLVWDAQAVTSPVGAYISGTETIGIETATSTGGAVLTPGSSFVGSVSIR